MRYSYEWIVELPGHGEGKGEADTFRDAKGAVWWARYQRSASRPERVPRIALMCSTLDKRGEVLDREWAYMDSQRQLPAFFAKPNYRGAYTATQHRVPQRYHDEWQQAPLDILRPLVGRAA